MEILTEVLASLTQFAGIFIEYIGIVVVIIAVVIALLRLVQSKQKRGGIRTELANNVMFGLDFIIAADILLVTVAASVNDVLKLGGIVIIRILLGYALRKETMR
jgi:uncharacterized membrane protein